MTAADLLALWRRRETQYATRRYPISGDELTAVHDWRRREMAALPANEQRKARRVFAAFLPSKEHVG